MEILIVTSQLRNIIREGALHQMPSAFQQGKSVGCQTMDQSLVSLVRNKLISKQDAEAYMLDRSSLHNV